MTKTVIWTYTGREVDPFNLKLDDIDPTDIITPLSRLPRFNGATDARHAYSVAQHCVAVAREVSPPARLAALLHDAAEAYLGDWIRPLRRYLCVDGRPWAAIEDAARNVIYERFAAPASPEILREVSRADDRVLEAELALYMKRGHYNQAPIVLDDPWPADQAETIYRTLLVYETSRRAAEC